VQNGIVHASTIHNLGERVARDWPTNVKRASFFSGS
jgi:hypothetical protein